MIDYFLEFLIFWYSQSFEKYKFFPPKFCNQKMNREIFTPSNYYWPSKFYVFCFVLFIVELGEVRHIIRLGAFHGADDAFFLQTYSNADYWHIDGMKPAEGLNY